MAVGGPPSRREKLRLERAGLPVPAPDVVEAVPEQDARVEHVTDLESLFVTEYFKSWQLTTSHYFDDCCFM